MRREAISPFKMANVARRMAQCVAGVFMTIAALCATCVPRNRSTPSSRSSSPQARIRRRPSNRGWRLRLRRPFSRRGDRDTGTPDLSDAASRHDHSSDAASITSENDVHGLPVNDEGAVGSIEDQTSGTVNK